jgi:hypothetical protein
MVKRISSSKFVKHLERGLELKNNPKYFNTEKLRIQNNNLHVKMIALYRRSLLYFSKLTNDLLYRTVSQFFHPLYFCPIT